MCLAKIYPPGAQEPVMENVAKITFEDGKIVAESLFGERRVFEETLSRISFTESRVQLTGQAGQTP